ncbi:nickel/cobalt transporter [Thioalkalivibrio sulfidiphilus]|uniref:nickel/cobalt transporter n=1 Tax=Thioalkalivibrio sulfidiphilus TaxID=1033854 RepID=UPI003B35F070
MRSGALILAVLFALLLWAPLLGASPLSGGSTTTHATASEPEALNAWERATLWVLNTQRDLHRQLARGMERIQNAPTAANTFALVLVGFLYGIFHAAGPGHGKAVITTYLLTHRQHMTRGLVLSWASSLLQGLTAIALVVGVVVIAERLTREALGHVRTLEMVSFALVAAVGAWLVFRALRGLWRLRPVAQHAHDHDHAHGHDHHHDHEHGCGCGHAHHVTPEQAARSDSLGAMIGTVVAVGIRPCTGAILVLAVANMLGLWMAGIAAVLAMSVGTAITVSVLAILAVQARHWAGRIAGSQGGSLAWARAGQGVALAGGLLIFALGVSLLGAGFDAPAHPLGL